MFGNLAAVLLFAAVCGLQAQHHHDPFAGSGIDTHMYTLASISEKTTTAHFSA